MLIHILHCWMVLLCSTCTIWSYYISSRAAVILRSDCRSNIYRVFVCEDWLHRNMCSMPCTLELNVAIKCLNSKRKGKAIPLKALTSPEGFRSLRLQDFKTIGTCRLQGCQPYAPATFTPRKCAWYSFLSEAESTLGP
jgi:hypothetical protein